MELKSMISADTAEKRITAIEDVHEIVMTPGSDHPLSGKGIPLKFKKGGKHDR